MAEPVENLQLDHFVVECEKKRVEANLDCQPKLTYRKFSTRQPIGVVDGIWKYQTGQHFFYPVALCMPFEWTHAFYTVCICEKN